MQVHIKVKSYLLYLHKHLFLFFIHMVLVCIFFLQVPKTQKWITCLLEERISFEPRNLITFDLHFWSVALTCAWFSGGKVNNAECTQIECYNSTYQHIYPIRNYGGSCLIAKQELHVFRLSLEIFSDSYVRPFLKNSVDQTNCNIWLMCVHSALFNVYLCSLSQAV